MPLQAPGRYLAIVALGPQRLRRYARRPPNINSAPFTSNSTPPHNSQVAPPAVGNDGGAKPFIPDEDTLITGTLYVSGVANTNSSAIHAVLRRKIICHQELSALGVALP